jgi:long-chain fatty acid transport protein
MKRADVIQLPWPGNGPRCHPPARDARPGWLAALALMMTCALPCAGWAQGVVLPGVGPINRSMAGAAVAAPLDAAGAIHWNPATIAALPRSEIMFGAEFLYPHTQLSSSIPALGLNGADDSDSGIATLPTSAVVLQSAESLMTYGLGVSTIGGFGANFPGSASNPILTPPPPAGVGVGPAYSELALVQMAPTAALWLTPRVAVGFAPTFTLAKLGVDPGFFAPPDDANGDLAPSYPPATHARYHWGLGFQAGVYVTTESNWQFGASIKSPQWFETFRFNSRNEIGAPRQLELNVDYPMILSVGAAYAGLENWLFAMDVRYIDYDSTQGFGHDARFNADGSVSGLGWKSIYSVAAGVQYRMSESTSLRAGYLHNDNPIPDEATFFNIVSSPVFQDAVFIGVSRSLTSSLLLSLSYLHAFDNSIAGPYFTPAGPIPGGSVRIDQTTDALTVGVHVFF